MSNLFSYISERIKGCTVKGINGEWLYVKKPFTDDLVFWLHQFKTKDCCGHSEWSEMYKRNIWIKDD